jgi:hypothetical protein
MTDRNPTLWRNTFTCPHCKGFAQQIWLRFGAEGLRGPPVSAAPDAVAEALAQVQSNRSDEAKATRAVLKAQLAALGLTAPAISSDAKIVRTMPVVEGVYGTKCIACEQVSLWVGTRVIFPDWSASVPEPNPDLSTVVKADYQEAAKVVSVSPRSAAALLRLAIQKTCQELLGRSGDVNEMIGELVKRGLNPMIQQALDVVRVVGNEAVHPGTIDLRDNEAVAVQLFTLVNLIAEAMISVPKHVADMYAALPASKLAGIERRDGRNAPASGNTGGKGEEPQS